VSEIEWDIGARSISPLVSDTVTWISPTATLLEVATELSASDIGALVVGDGQTATGIISERDVVHALAAGREPRTTHAGDVASTVLLWCDAEASIGEVAAEMMEHYVRHLLVEEEGRLVGVVSARDLLGAYAAGFEPD
jgi:CBS domain-containing protein